METRLRLLILRAGLPPPEVQWVVQDPATRTAFWLDRARIVAELSRARARST